MNIYDMDRKKLKAYDRKFMFTAYGMRVKAFAVLPMILGIICLACVLFDFGISSKDSGLLMEMIAAAGFLVCFGLGAIANIEYYKLLKEYILSQKK